MGEGGFHGHRIWLDEQGLEDRVELAVDLGGLGVLVGESQLGELHDLFWQQVRSDADHALGSDGHERQGETVVAAEHGDVLAHGLLQLVDAVDGTAGLLDGADMWILGSQALDHGHADFDAATSGDGIEDDRLVGGFREFGEMAEQTGLAGLVVIRCHDQHGVGTGFMGKLGEFHGFVSGV